MLCATGTPRRRILLSCTSSISSEEVCNMPTTLVIVDSEPAGTRSKELNAAINAERISLPGCEKR